MKPETKQIDQLLAYHTTLTQEVNAFHHMICIALDPKNRRYLPPSISYNHVRHWEEGYDSIGTLFDLVPDELLININDDHARLPYLVKIESLLEAVAKTDSTLPTLRWDLINYYRQYEIRNRRSYVKPALIVDPFLIEMGMIHFVHAEQLRANAEELTLWLCIKIPSVIHAITDTVIIDLIRKLGRAPEAINQNPKLLPRLSELLKELALASENSTLTTPTTVITIKTDQSKEVYWQTESLNAPAIISTPVNEQGQDNSETFADYIKEEYRGKLLPFLTSNYSGAKPEIVVPMVAALSKGEYLTYPPFNNKTRLHKLLTATFGDGGKRNSISQAVNRLDSPYYQEEITRHLSLIKRALND